MKAKEKNKIIVTGGLGFLGQHIVKKLSSAYPQHTIVILARTKRKLWVFENIPENIQIETNVHFEDSNSYKHHISHGSIIVHNAALISFFKNAKEKIYKSNVDTTKNLLEIAYKNKVKKIIFISSISAIASNGIKESTETNDFVQDEIFKDPYAHSKFLAEKEFEKYKDKLDYIILNPSLIIGPGTIPMSKLLKWLLTFPIIPTVNFMHSFVDARDVANAVCLAIESKISGERFIVNSENIRINTVLKIAAHALNKQVILVNIPKIFIEMSDITTRIMSRIGLYPFSKTPQTFLADKAYSSEKITKTLGWKPNYSIKNSISDTINWDANKH